MSTPSLPTAVLLCPGRGSYGKQELGDIARTLRPGPVAQALAVADATRAARGEAAISALDAAAAFRPSTHLQGQNAAELIYFATMAHVESLRGRYRVVGVAGNSLGWYTALAAAGCVTPLDGWRLVASMARAQIDAAGGQVLTTTVDDEWRTDPERVAAVEATLAEVNALGADCFAAHSIRLGGHAVLAGTEKGVAELLRRLPKVTMGGRPTSPPIAPPLQRMEPGSTAERRVGDREFPFRLAGHGPFHTPLCAAVAERARTELADLPIRAPDVHLIDGHGNLHTPWSADPQALLAYTTGAQVTETFDFTAAVRTAIRELNPDVLVCLGPGSSLRAPVGHVVVREGYRGVRHRTDLFASELVVAP